MNQEYWQLRAASRNYQDAYHFTTRLSNRLKALEEHKDEALDMDVLREQLESAKKVREGLGKSLSKLYMRVAPPSICAFQQATPGLGELYMAQLVGVVGDFKSYTPAWWEENPEASSRGSFDSQTSADEKPEKRILMTGDVQTAGVRDIWAYCGHGDAARRRVRGADQDTQFAAGSPLAKTIVHMMSDFAVRLNGVPDKNGKSRALCPYYWLYAEAKEEGLAKHEKWTRMHADNHAKRKVGKAILKDVWRVQHGQEPVFGAQTPWIPRVPPSYR